MQKDNFCIALFQIFGNAVSLSVSFSAAIFMATHTRADTLSQFSCCCCWILILLTLTPAFSKSAWVHWKHSCFYSKSRLWTTTTTSQQQFCLLLLLQPYWESSELLIIFHFCYMKGRSAGPCECICASAFLAGMAFKFIFTLEKKRENTVFWMFLIHSPCCCCWLCCEESQVNGGCILFEGT